MSAPCLTIPFGDQPVTGTPDQFRRLALWLHQHTAAANPARGARVTIWDGQQLVATYADLALLADRLLALVEPPPERARYHAVIPNAAYMGDGIPFAEPVTQTLNARGATGGLRAPGPDDARPADPTAPALSTVPQPYLAQVHRADLVTPGGWAPEGPEYSCMAGHILVAAVRIACEQRLLLVADQLLAVRWLRSPGWDCYLPAGLLNDWSLLVAAHLAPATRLEVIHAHS